MSLLCRQGRAERLTGAHGLALPKEPKHMKETCEVKNCKESVFATAFPEDLKYKLCRGHFMLKMGKFAQGAKIVDLTEDRKDTKN